MATQAYMDWLPARMTELRFLMLDAASFPYMNNESDRKTAIARWQAELSKVSHEAPRTKPITRAILARIGIGVESNGR